MSRKYNCANKGRSVGGVSNWQRGVISDCFSTEFPNGLRVLVVDDDPTCLRVIERMIQTLDYKVTSCRQAEVALEILRENKDMFDIVVIDIHMPGMNGIELLQHVGVETDLPVVMMSADDQREVVHQGVVRGACDYLIKPVTLESLKTIWQHVLRKKGFVLRRLGQPRSNEDCNQVHALADFCRTVDHRTISEEHTRNPNHLKREREDKFEDECKDYDAAKAKRRMVWTPELHKKFLQAVDFLGDKAVPMKILECMQKMNVPEITRENIASHLQKYRLHLRRRDESSEQKHQHDLPSPSSAEVAFFDENPLFDGSNFERGACSTQFPVQSDLITSTWIALQDESSTPFHSFPSLFSYYPSDVTLPPDNFPCINATEAGASSNNVYPLVNSTLITDDPENWGQGNVELHDGTYGGGASAQLIDEPSLLNRYFDKNEFFPVLEPNDGADQIGDFNSDWQSHL